MKPILKLLSAHAKRIQVSRNSSLHTLTSSFTMRKILHSPMAWSTFTCLLEICRLKTFSSAESFFFGFLIGRLTSAFSRFKPINPKSSQSMTGTSNLISSSSQILLSCAFHSYVGDKYNTFFRRAFRKTCCFSKKHLNHFNAFNLVFFYINFGVV